MILETLITIKCKQLILPAIPVFIVVAFIVAVYHNKKHPDSPETVWENFKPFRQALGF